MSSNDLHSDYRIPAEIVSSQEVIKKSRFITLLSHQRGEAAAKDWILNCRRVHQNAGHCCWAFVASRPNTGQQLGCSDDGEPPGTAGKPMLAQLQGSGIGEICAVVIRYSGGIKLGTGGLVKAYGGGVKKALSQLQTMLYVPQQRLRVTAPYTYAHQVKYHVDAINGKVVKSEFLAQDCTFDVDVPISKAMRLRSTLISQTQNSCSVIVIT